MVLPFGIKKKIEQAWGIHLLNHKILMMTIYKIDSMKPHSIYINSKILLSSSLFLAPSLAKVMATLRQQRLKARFLMLSFGSLLNFPFDDSLFTVLENSHCTQNIPKYIFFHFFVLFQTIELNPSSWNKKSTLIYKASINRHKGRNRQ